ncbi:MAG: zf-HC2 domain-containing protein [Acidobacteriota bacterium]
MSPHESGGTCSPWDEQIEAFVDGELDDDRELLLRAHLVGCRRCRREVALAGELQRELRRLPMLDLPATVRTQVPSPVPVTRATPQVRPWLPWAAGLAALLALMVGLERPPATPTAVEVARAEHEARLAFAYIAEAGRKTGRELRDGVIRERVVAPVREGWRRALPPPEAEEEI